MALVKICGITHVKDVGAVAESGAAAVGINLIPSSKRCVSIAQAAELVRHARGLETVAVVADLPLEELQLVFRRTGVALVQLHGTETEEYVQAALGQFPGAVYKAVRVAVAADVAHARRYGGDRILVDAKVEGQLGGTGHCFDWSLVTELAQERPLVLAGGLTVQNVAAAVALVRPWAVDVASGVEAQGEPRRKDPSLVGQFVERARVTFQGERR